MFTLIHAGFIYKYKLTYDINGDSTIRLQIAWLLKYE
jgi:hypothetical protein